MIPNHIALVKLELHLNHCKFQHQLTVFEANLGRCGTKTSEMSLCMPSRKAHLTRLMSSNVQSDGGGEESVATNMNIKENVQTQLVRQRWQCYTYFQAFASKTACAIAQPLHLSCR